MEHLSFLSDKTIAIVGGAGSWGAKISNTLREVAHDVVIIDTDTKPDDVRTLIKSSDIIFLASPAQTINGILMRTRDLLDEKIVLDCATTKSGFADMLKEISQSASVCSTHPMVKPETQARGQNVLLMPVGPHAEKATATAQEIFGRLEMRQHTIDFNQHQDLMSILQFVPHLVHRVLISTLGKILADKGMKLETVEDIAPANFLVTELAIGRVGMQKPGTSAEIIEEALSTPFGRRIMKEMRKAIVGLLRSSLSEGTLQSSLDTDVKRLDPSGDWRKRMTEKTEVMIEAMGNLRARSFQLEAHHDEPGLLRRICDVLEKHGINMTAVHSHLQETETGRCVRFDIGIDDTDVSFEVLASEFADLNITCIKK